MNIVAIRRAHFHGIFIISLSLLAYQVVLTRIFSVVLYYHFAFAGISLAMLGLTLGAEKVFQNPARFTPSRFDREWAKAALGYAFSSIIIVLAFLYLPLAIPNNVVATAIIPYFLLFFVIPFTYGGICVTLILTNGGGLVGRLYAADLLGAAIGCMGVVFILFYIDPITIMLALAALSAISAYKVAGTSAKGMGLTAILFTLLFTTAAGTQGWLYVTEGKHLRVVWAKSSEQNNLLFERWNAFSRVRVAPYNSPEPFGWGFGHKQETGPEQKWMDIDSDAGTVLTNFDGNISKLAFLSNDIVNIGYHLRPPKEVVVIGVGGGRDILSALYFGVTKVTGLELNPAIFEALTHKFADFTGNIHKRSDVELINTEARSWISEHKRKFDLVQISLIDTWAATAAGGLTLAENKLYTVDSWREFMDTLNPKGLLVVARWYNEKEHKGEFYKLMALAAETLKQEGIKPSEIKNHMLLYSTPRIVSIAISRTAFTIQEIAHMEAVAEKEGFKLLAGGDVEPDEISRTIASGKADAKWFATHLQDYSAPTDDRPFFFYMNRMSDLLSKKPATSLANAEPNSVNSPAIGVVFTIFIATAYCLLFFIIKPTLRLQNPMKFAELRGQLLHIAYFAFIGLGFMMIEISQMQRLMILLGHPVYGLSVVLFTMLLFAGLGSYTMSPNESKPGMGGRAFMLCIVMALTGWLTPYATELVRNYGIGARIAASVAVLAPISFFLGMMFPIGMKLTQHVRFFQPWFWGINGAASVFGSVLGMVVSLECGISSAFWYGVYCYIICTIIILQLCRKRDEVAEA